MSSPMEMESQIGCLTWDPNSGLLDEQNTLTTAERKFLWLPLFKKSHFFKGQTQVVMLTM